MRLPWAGSPCSQPLASRCVPRSKSPRSMRKKLASLRTNGRLAGSVSRRRPRVQPGAQRYPDHHGAPQRRPSFPAAVEPAPRHRALCRPDPGDQLVLGPHRARLHAAVRPAEPAPERAAPRCTGLRPPAPSRNGRSRPRPAPSARAARRTRCRGWRRNPEPDTRNRRGQAAFGRRQAGHGAKPATRAGKIAAANKPANVSLDQMLVALLRANPDAFIGGNVNRLKAGAVLDVPTEEQAGARARWRSQADDRCPEPRLQRIPPSPRRGPARHPASALPTGRLAARSQAQVEEKKAVAPTPDKLTLSKGARPGQGRPRTRSPASAPPRKPPPAWRNSTRTSATSTSSASPPLRRACCLPAARAPPSPAWPLPTGSADAVKPVTAAPMVAATPVAAAATAPAPISAASAPAPAASARGGHCPRHPRVRRLSRPVRLRQPRASARRDWRRVARERCSQRRPRQHRAATPAASAAKAAPAPAAPAETSLVDDLLENPIVPASIGADPGPACWASASTGPSSAGSRRQVDSSFLESRLQPDSFFGASGGQRIDTNDASGTGSSMVVFAQPARRRRRRGSGGRGRRLPGLRARPAGRGNPEGSAAHNAAARGHPQQAARDLRQAPRCQGVRAGRDRGLQPDARRTARSGSTSANWARNWIASNSLYRGRPARLPRLPRPPPARQRAGCAASARRCRPRHCRPPRRPRTDLDLDLDFSLGDDEPAAPAPAHAATQPHREPRRHAACAPAWTWTSARPRSRWNRPRAWTHPASRSTRTA